MPRPTCLLLRSRARQDPCRGKVSPRLSSRLTESRKRKNTINFPHHLITAAIALTNSAQSIWALAGGRLRKHSALKRSRAALARDFRLLAGEYILQVYIYISHLAGVCVLVRHALASFFYALGPFFWPSSLLFRRPALRRARRRGAPRSRRKSSTTTMTTGSGRRLR